MRSRMRPRSSWSSGAGTVADASAPASSANLGPGFDCLALALELRCRVTAVPASGWSVVHDGAQRPDVDADDAVLDAARRAAPRTPLALTVRNDIPIARGLGSSSAAAAAGALAAFRATGHDPDPRQVFEIVAEMEGHPDNAAATVFGGLVLATGGHVHRLPWRSSMSLIVAVPDEPFPTREARDTLPPAYSSEVVVRSIGRVAALVAGLLGNDASVLADSSGDEIHEDVRSRVRPDVAALVTTARNAGAAHACWSGAGPSVLALVEANGRARVRSALEGRLGSRGIVLELEVATDGAV